MSDEQRDELASVALLGIIVGAVVTLLAIGAGAIAGTAEAWWVVGPAAGGLFCSIGGAVTMLAVMLPEILPDVWRDARSAARRWRR